ncbi:MAG: hypothetical protein MK105_15165 [Crocinitomicaceae bacterium]|nr:hypothetical protein [Crocinitomicaceae bacterium]
MYSQNSISVLSSRIKWYAPTDHEYANILDDTNTAGEFDKAFQDVHKNVTIQNIHCTQPNANISKSDFNKYLKRMSITASQKVIQDVFDLNEKADRSKNYDELISYNISIFDNAIMLNVGIQVLQLIISTNRINLTETIQKLSYNKLKVELEGATNDNGIVVSVGLNYKYYKSITKVKEILFPQSDGPFLNSESRW